MGLVPGKSCMSEDPIAITGGPLQPHEFVLIKSDMTAADEAWIQNHAARSKGKGADTEIVFTIGEVQLATAKRMVKGWNLTKKTTNPITKETYESPIPFNEQAINELPRRVYKFILRKIDEMNPDDEEGKTDEDFLPSVVDSSMDHSEAQIVFRQRG